MNPPKDFMKFLRTMKDPLIAPKEPQTDESTEPPYRFEGARDGRRLGGRWQARRAERPRLNARISAPRAGPPRERTMIFKYM